MCLILFSLRDHPSYKLILGANRDEFYSRRTAAADYWEDYPFIIGGRDLEASGTWMAMTLQGKIAMVTNYRDPFHINPNAPSRGKLVTDYLIDPKISALDYLRSIEPVAEEYNGFNLLIGNCDELFYFSNYSKGIRQVDNGLHGLSNHLLETPWPKVVRGKEKLSSLRKDRAVDVNEVLNILYDDQTAPNDRLPSTGIPIDREKALSSMFIKTNDYGTRCSTAILINHKNEVTYAERQFNLMSFSFTTNRFEFRV
jgi:uncharacterized protein with NRDE domain